MIKSKLIRQRSQSIPVFIQIKSPRNHQQAFTLIELLVVITIIGLLLTMAQLSVGTHGDAQIQQEAKRFHAVVQLVAEEAILNSNNYVIRLTEQGYEFALLGINGEHVPMEEPDKLFMPHALPHGLRFKAELNGEPVTLVSSFDEDHSKVPSIFLFSSGEMTPFVVEIESEEGTRFGVGGDYAGKVVFQGRTDSRES